MNDNQSDTIETLPPHRSDAWIFIALLGTMISWTLCVGAIVLHAAGVGSVMADAIGIACSILTGAAWAAIILLIHD